MSFLLRISVAIAIISLCLATQSKCFGQTDGKIEPVAIEHAVILSPANTSISFVGTHTGDDPEPQIGGFGVFDGYIKVDPKTKQVVAISATMDTDSLWTEIGELTRHLKNKDFFDVQRFPNARFTSTKIEWESETKCTVAGELTLHGKTADISFPADVTFKNGGLKFNAQFKIDRTLFDVGKPSGGISNLVSIEIAVGRPTDIPPEKEDDDDDD